VCSATPVGAADAVGLAALGAVLAVAAVAVCALGAADDGPGPGGGSAGAAFAVQLDHDLGAQGGVLLLPPHPGGQLPGRAFPGWEQAPVEGHKRRVQHGHGRIAGGAGRQAEAVALPGGPQRPVRDPEFLAGLVDADLGGPLPGLLGRRLVPVEPGALRPALEGRRLGQAVVTERAAQRLLGDEPAGLAALAEALTLAAPEGHLRVFVDEGAPMATLLGRLLTTPATTQAVTAAQVPPAFLDRLLEAFEQAGQAALPRSRRGATLPGLVAALSARELEVLQLLAAGRPNPAIAEELVVSLDTVKRHVTHILDKLGAANRTQAVTRARELGLLR
jgi:DNA-binding CsgD family transcriptional regulator